MKFTLTITADSVDELKHFLAVTSAASAGVVEATQFTVSLPAKDKAAPVEKKEKKEKVATKVEEKAEAVVEATDGEHPLYKEARALTIEVKNKLGRLKQTELLEKYDVKSPSHLDAANFALYIADCKEALA